MDRSIATEPPAWVEVDLAQFRRNWDAITRYCPAGVSIAYVVKDDAYGHGALPLSEIALELGAEMLVVASVLEALELRRGGIEAPVLILGERAKDDYALCVRHNFSTTIGSHSAFAELQKAARSLGRAVPIHVKIDTGMSRYGFRWSEADEVFAVLRKCPEIVVEGIMSHFAMSDELDKTFANLQLARFKQVLSAAREAGFDPKYRHICNSGGFLDLPEAHFNLVRIGILPLGVYPSKVCRRLQGIGPIMSVKSRLSAVKELQPGDHVGYGMRFTAEKPMRSAVIPVGYGFGYPRVRNQGHVLIHGQRAPIIGGVSMDAITVDLSDVIEAKEWDEVTLLGRNGQDEITIQDIAALRNSVSYDAMVSWSPRLPRRYLQ
jgi:alanine racemase